MGTTPLLTSATNTILNAQYKATVAADKIARLPLKEDEVGSSNFSSNDLLKPLISLNEATLETKAGAKIIQVEKEIIGSLFDVFA